jgi:hypothetical protein
MNPRYRACRRDRPRRDSIVEATAARASSAVQAGFSDSTPGRERRPPFRDHDN